MRISIVLTMFLLFTIGAYAQVGKRLNTQDINKTAYERYVNPSLYNKSLDGFIVGRDGKKVNVEIKYESPSSFQDETMPLITYKSGGGKEKKYLKSKLTAFFVNGHLHVPEQLGDSSLWVMVSKEGAIRESVFFKPDVEYGEPSYYTVNRIIANTSLKEGFYLGSLAINFNKNMYSLVSDNKEISDKILDRVRGYKFVDYQKIMAEYNIWINKNYPDQVNYFQPIPDYQKIIANDIGSFVGQ